MLVKYTCLVRQQHSAEILSFVGTVSRVVSCLGLFWRIDRKYEQNFRTITLPDQPSLCSGPGCATVHGHSAQFSEAQDRSCRARLPGPRPGARIVPRPRPGRDLDRRRSVAQDRRVRGKLGLVTKGRRYRGGTDGLHASAERAGFEPSVPLVRPVPNWLEKGASALCARSAAMRAYS